MQIFFLLAQPWNYINNATSSDEFTFSQDTLKDASNRNNCELFGYIKKNTLRL